MQKATRNRKTKTKKNMGGDGLDETRVAFFPRFFVFIVLDCSFVCFGSGGILLAQCREFGRRHLPQGLFFLVLVHFFGSMSRIGKNLKVYILPRFWTCSTP